MDIDWRQGVLGPAMHAAIHVTIPVSGVTEGNSVHGGIEIPDRPAETCGSGRTFPDTQDSMRTCLRHFWNLRGIRRESALLAREAGRRMASVTKRKRSSRRTMAMAALARQARLRGM